MNKNKTTNVQAELWYIFADVLVKYVRKKLTKPMKQQNSSVLNTRSTLNDIKLRAGPQNKNNTNICLSV